MITSRMLSMPVCVAASISKTSMSRPSAISTQASHSPQGSGVGPFTQFRHRARMRAVVVFPTPRAPAKMNAWASRPRRKRVAEGRGYSLLTNDVFEALRAPAAGEDLVGHRIVVDCGVAGCRLNRRRAPHRDPGGLRHSSGST